MQVVTGQVSEQERRQRKMLVLAPLIVMPLMALCFHGLGGGNGVKGHASGPSGKGLNMSLPEAKFDPKKKGLNKLGFYTQADQDSMKLSERRKEDPYYGGQASPSRGRSDGWNRGSMDTGFRRLAPGHLGADIGGLNGGAHGDEQADELLKKLDLLKVVLNKQEEGQRLSGLSEAAGLPGHGDRALPYGDRAGNGSSLPGGSAPGSDVPGRGDPDLDKLSGMLDKILRIQHPAEGKTADTSLAERRNVGQLTAAGKDDGVGTMTTEEENKSLSDMGRIPGPTGKSDTDEVVSGSGFMELDEQGADPGAENTVEASVVHDQTLVSGESVELRLAQEAVINGVRIPLGTLMTGKASLSSERLLVVVSSIRIGSGVLPVSLEVIDMDGVAGIREQGSINRDVSKESADEAIGSLGVTSLDPSLGGQAAAAGLQAAKTLLSRKVRLVRVSLPAGYRVLLRNTKSVNH